MPDVPACPVAAVPANGAARCEVDGRTLCVVHLVTDGIDEWYALDDRCSHADYSLSEGYVWEDERSVECPQHGAQFSLATGEPLTLPATRPVAVYPARVEGDDVIVTVP